MLAHTERPDEATKEKLYCESANNATYCRLRRLTKGILHAGYSVVVDATFLKKCQRDCFRELAQEQGVAFAILDFRTDEQTLRQRVADRMARNNDASDADIQVLESQLMSQEPLTVSETRYVVQIPDTVSAISAVNSQL